LFALRISLKRRSNDSGMNANGATSTSIAGDSHPQPEARVAGARGAFVKGMIDATGRGVWSVASSSRYAPKSTPQSSCAVRSASACAAARSSAGRRDPPARRFRAGAARNSGARRDGT
jgi:hypothetical protein